eukprot:GAHX01001525.1.p1 GENE.GAHX01001525.1~~GAHX01001525.1.p1  ORF type:complete len:576 (+),score=99.36 GAHX01001525.1:1584-3311(+)
MEENNPTDTQDRVSFSLRGESKIYNLIDKTDNNNTQGNKKRKFSNSQHSYTELTNVSQTPKNTWSLENLQGHFYIISCIVLCLNAGITFVADFHGQLRLTMGYPEILIKQLTTIGVASAACVGFVLDRILNTFALKTTIIANSALLSVSYLLFTCLVSITNANKLSGASFYFVTTMVIIMWAIINFLSGINFFIALKTARTFTKESSKSTVIGILSCAFSLSISFISLIHDTVNNNLSLFFGILSAVNLISIVIYIVYHQKPLWYVKQEQEELENIKQNEKLGILTTDKNKEERTRLESSVFVNTSVVFEKAVLSSRVTVPSNLARGRSTSRIFSTLLSNQTPDPTFGFKEIPKMSFFEELRTFKAIVCVLTVFLCVGIQKNIYFVMRELSVYILKVSGTHEMGSSEFVRETKDLVSKYGKIISLTSALARLVSGIILDYMYRKQWVYSPFPMVVFFMVLLFGACLFAAISPFWAVKTTVLQCAFGFSGGLYGILPVIIGIVVSVEKFNKMLGFAEFSSTFGMLLFANLTTIINVIFGKSHTLNIYFGICCLFMGVLAVLNYIAKEKINKDVLNK